MKRSSRFLLSLLAGFALLVSCNIQEIRDELGHLSETKLPNWEGEFAVPVLNANLSIADFLGKFETGGFLRVESDGAMTLIYRGEVFSNKGKTLFSFSSISSLPVFTHNATYPVPAPDGMRIDLVGFKSATFDYQFTAQAAGTVRIISPSFTQGATAFDQTIDVPAAGTFSGSFPLDGWAMAIDNSTISINYTVDGGTSTSLSNFTVGINNIEYSELQGYFGNLALGLPRDTIVLDMFKNQELGKVTFYDPKVSLEVTNSYGFPLRLRANPFTFETKYNGNLSLSQQLVDGIDFNYPTLAEKGNSKKTFIVFDTATSALKDIISGIPLSLDFAMTAGANPNGDTGEKNFLVDTSYISVVADVQFPLKASITEFVVNQDFAFNFAGYDLVQSGALRLVTYNEFPFDLALQTYLLDANGTVIDSLFPASQLNAVPRGKILLAAADVDAQGRSTGAKEAITDFILDAARIEKLKQASKVRLRLAFATVENGSKMVSIFTDYGIEMKMGLVGKANVPLGGN